MSEDKRLADLYDAVANALEVDVVDILAISYAKSKPDGKLDTYAVLVGGGPGGSARRMAIPTKGIGKPSDIAKANKAHEMGG